jgi:hypothetical protein
LQGKSDQISNYNIATKALLLLKTTFLSNYFETLPATVTQLPTIFVTEGFTVHSKTSIHHFQRDCEK